MSSEMAQCISLVWGGFALGVILAVAFVMLTTEANDDDFPRGAV